MKTNPFENVNIKGMMDESFRLTHQMIKSYELLMRVDDVDVGTSEKEVVFENYNMKLYKFTDDKKSKGLPPIFLIYSLVNRHYMLDLQPDRSLIRNLLNEGFDLYLMDTGYPTEADQFLSVDDYINGFINDCVDFICNSTGYDKISIIGTCQGGVMSLIYTALYPEKIKYLIPLVTPVDFSIDEGVLYSLARHINAEKLMQNMGIIPGEMLMASLMILKPFFRVYKYVSSLDMIDESEKMLNFLRMERWLFDTPSIPGECNRQFVEDLYKANKLVEGGMIVGDKEVDLKNIKMPVLNIYAAFDHIVPPSSTKILDKLVGSKDFTTHRLETGHIGVFVGSRSQKELAPLIKSWVEKRETKTRKSNNEKPKTQRSRKT